VGFKNLNALLMACSVVSAWRIVVTSTPEGWRRTERITAFQPYEQPGPRLIRLPQLSPQELKAVSEQHPDLGRVLYDQRMGFIVRRPKVLDLIARESVTQATTERWVCEADIIDWFFATVIERHAGDGRRAMVVGLAAQLADALADSMPEDELDPATVDRAASLCKDRVLRTQDGRIGFD